VLYLVENEDLRLLFTDIASYVVTLRGDIDEGHVGKKRKIADRNGNGEVKWEGTPGTVEAMMTANMNSVPNENGGRNRDSKAETGPIALTVKDVSFSMPVRKKLTLEITLGGEGAIGGKGSVIRGVNQGSGDVEFVVGYEDIGEFLFDNFSYEMANMDVLQSTYSNYQSPKRPRNKRTLSSSPRTPPA
jgi:hypothetical protein